ncbi:hypothetical protein O181_112980 [Austropuccinia psidii MF-1]|uniref:Uncharacterized protein n=1 Tax=Austropuccinia psidii MF-1 TaxID=1389203 RepID=A0A9Q3K5I0_9BASI|nr:hypothetical protein [Austropuccinia psidii MF-1]
MQSHVTPEEEEWINNGGNQMEETIFLDKIISALKSADKGFEITENDFFILKCSTTLLRKSAKEGQKFVNDPAEASSKKDKHKTQYQKRTVKEKKEIINKNEKRSPEIPKIKGPSHNATILKKC